MQTGSAEANTPAAIGNSETPFICRNKKDILFVVATVEVGKLKICVTVRHRWEAGIVSYSLFHCFTLLAW